MKLLYFAWIRERIGKPEEEIEIPVTVTTTTALVDWLKGRGGGYAVALGEPRAVRIAVDRVRVAREASLAGAKEVAIFPPMTGG